ncbi:MAG: hypothetical protein ACOYUZ_04045 [Patescibacteria group bacterium]
MARNFGLIIKLSSGFLSTFLGILLSVNFAIAAAPSGADWFQLIANPSTGSDNTGDGGTGLPQDLNYYYVGQSFLTTIQIQSGGTTAANILIDYDTNTSTASNLMIGTYFPSWAGQSISGGRVMSTGYRTSGQSSGLGNFGTVQWTMDAPSEAAYGSSTPSILDINIGTIGATTESNISLAGVDLLDDAEDFQMLVWADTVKPYAGNASPASGSANVAVDANYLFDLRDSLNGEGDDNGYGTGVNTATPPGAITINAVDQTPYDAYVCSGVWGTNLCSVTVNPPSPSGITGDTRNWDYNTLYTVQVSGFEDLASNNQNQLGDANGPNTMNLKSWAFTSEADIVAPQVVAEVPARSSLGNATSTNVTVTVHDKKVYPGNISGTGVNATSCRISISSASFASTTFQAGDAGVTINPVDYGFDFIINPAGDFGRNEAVSVTVYGCADLASNAMTADSWIFTTADDFPPFVDQLAPPNDSALPANGMVRFHIKDSDGGVDLNNVVAYLNGVYYTNGGGAGSVTTNGTRITFSSSLDFNGGNYGGDSTSVTGSATDYTILLDPQNAFTAGEAVPLIVYAKDLSGNIMERYVAAWAVGGGAVTPGTTSSGGGGSPLSLPQVNVFSIQAVQVDETTVLVSWLSNVDSEGRVVFDDQSHASIGGTPNFGYSQTTEYTGIKTTYHSVIIDSLAPGTVYSFRPVIKVNGSETYGPEVRMAPLYAVKTVEKIVEIQVEKELPICKAQPPVYIIREMPTGAGGEAPAPVTIEAEGFPESLLKILNIEKKESIVEVEGKAAPNSKLKIYVY